MKGAIRRWAGRLTWVLPALLAIYSIVQLADLAWYRAGIPRSFQEANWSGIWETRSHGGLSGRLLVRLPDPLPVNQDFKADALVYYPIYSVWKTGQFVKMEFAGRYNPASPTPTGRSTNAIPGGGMLKFKGVAGHQTVEYAALVDESRTRIVGGYLSREPEDYGHFFIRYD